MRNAMVLITVTYHLKPGCREAFVKAVLEEKISEQTRMEEGNLEYRYSLPLDSLDEVCLLEKWDSRACLAPHGAQPHYLRLQELKALYVEKTSVKRFETTAL